MKDSKETLKQALQRQRRQMSLKGVLDFTGIQTDNLADLNQQNALVELIINDSSIKNFSTLKEQKNMKSIIADNSKIQTLAGLSIQPRLSKISLINTPIGNTENFRIAALVAIGQRLSSINGIPVTKSERRMAQCYPPIAKRLVDHGWALQYPPPSLLDFKYLVKKFGLGGVSEEEYLAQLPPPKNLSPPASPKKSQILVDDIQDQSFSEKVAGILRPLGFAIRYGAEMNNDILSAVSSICEVVSKIENINDEEEEINE
ncbi:hypothetical protein TRFO_16634 [Tritrichomonas foetus]|uniref:Uncharacterized protein n=1 Tax=Tritrichomonas foetus TaxID=1144522 RepID=A0A1J4KUV8_9EUKA|nr:hypothetical protein TRFO_16634 [Tritrichomonas foetus]|eukprot:OHT13301.1 hypothetical protein TRFO_16634 [Tritrichomonas foetus]